MIPMTSAIRVDSTSCVKCEGLMCYNMECNMRLETPIIRSQTPPTWDAWGGLKTHKQPSAMRHLLILGSWESFNRISSSLQAPTKLVPQSDLLCLASPRKAKNLLKAFTKGWGTHAVTSLICQAPVLIQVKRMAHVLLCACPPHVLLVMTVHGPNTSSPTYVNSGSVLSRSMGKSAIFCSVIFPWNLLHVM